MTAREVPADEALRIGLIGHVVPDGSALDKALEIAAVIGANGPLAVEAILRSVRETEGMSEVDGLARELEIGWPVFAQQRRHRGAEGLRREAPAQLHAHVSSDAGSAGGSRPGPGRGLPGHRRRGHLGRRRPAHQPGGRRAAPHRRGDHRPAARGRGPRRGGGRAGRAWRTGSRRRRPRSKRPRNARAQRLPRRPPPGPLPDQPHDRLRQSDRAAGRGVGGARPRTASARSAAASPSTTPTRAADLRARRRHRRAVRRAARASNIFVGLGAMTGTLTIRYRRPTPLLAPLELAARHTGASAARSSPGAACTTRASSRPRPRASSSTWSPSACSTS